MWARRGWPPARISTIASRRTATSSTRSARSSSRASRSPPPSAAPSPPRPASSSAVWRTPRPFEYGGPRDGPPNPPTLGASRRSGAAPLDGASPWGPERAPTLPSVRSVPAKPGRSFKPRDTPKAHSSAPGGFSQTEGEANGAIDRRQLDRREDRQALRQRPAWNRGDGVEVHHARLRHAVARTEGHLARDLPDACRHPRDGAQLSDHVG